MALLILLLLLILCFISHSSSQALLLLPLTHSIFKTQFNSTHHLLKSTSTRSLSRFQHQRKQKKQLSLPLSPGSDYTLSLNLGPQPITLYMDTGSDVVWFPCSPFECILCEGKPLTAKPANITKAHKVSCQSPACSAAHASMSTSNLCAIARCPLDSIETSDCSSSSYSCPPFYFAYGDGSFIARLYRHKLSVSSLSIHNFTFGCAHTALAEPTGVAGFGRGILSLPAQLATFSPHLGNRFSYCLVSHSFDGDNTVRKPSPLILGHHENAVEGENEQVEFVYTSMLLNPKHPYFYCVGLTGISVGKRVVPAPEMLRRVDEKGYGGMVVDSGTTFTMLPASLYNAVVDEFDRRVRRVHKRASEVEEKTGLGPCYYLDGLVQMIPAVTLHFVGNNNNNNSSGTSSVVLPRKNYFYEFLEGGNNYNKVMKERKVGCMMLINGGDDDEDELSGPGATLGNYQQQGFEVVYDLEKQRVGFAKRECGLLWDSLNKN